jgi:DNA repair exonuclease SbcCD ATPase subunit
MAEGQVDVKRYQIISLLYIVFICFSVINIKISVLDSNIYTIKSLQSIEKEELKKVDISNKIIADNLEVLNKSAKAASYLKIRTRLTASYTVINNVLKHVDEEFVKNNTTIYKQFNSKNLIEEILKSDKGVKLLEKDLFDLSTFINKAPFKLQASLDSVIPIQSSVTTIKGKQENWAYYLFYHKPTSISYMQLERIKLLITKTQLLYQEAALAEILSIDEDSLRNEVTAHKSRIKEITVLLEQPDFKKLPEAADLDEKILAHNQKIDSLDTQLSTVNDQLAVVERINKSLDDSYLGIQTALNQISDLLEMGDPYLKLQGWVDGKNVAGLSLTNFVLQERLEMILEYASRHLRRMSNGKYEFRLFEEKQGRTKKAGLGITIMDYFAGKERPAETLSGGETFYASLALALGLVEVVKGENGGIELGTLFIDEGFGSLSDDTLEEVLDVLEDLREERVIGIISHVEGMKTQIPMRLEVRQTEAGPSKVKMAIANLG